MQILIVTGYSGAGKSMAVDILEDIGYFCVDNMPPMLIKTFVDMCIETGTEIDKLALVTDVRGELFQEVSKGSFLEYLKESDKIKMIFLEASDETLIERYQETRRRHPLAGKAGSLTESIRMEKDLLSDLRQASDFIIDTTGKKYNDLKMAIKRVCDQESTPQLSQVIISSFGYKYGLPRGADYVFDVRFLPNPFYKKELRNKTGKDQEVRDYVMSFPAARSFYDAALGLLELVLPEFKNINKDQVEIAFGCTGGQHRSVTMVHLMEAALRGMGYPTKTIHRDIYKDRTEV